MNESQLDENVVYTLRIELLNGRVLLYAVDGENKEYLANNLRLNADGSYEEGSRLSFLWFETTYNRQVVVNATSIARVVFVSAPFGTEVNQGHYRDNFKVIENETLPQAIVYHKGNAPEDNSQKNP